MPKSRRTRATGKPLTDEEGEVRELLMEDIRQFRPALEALPPSLLAKLRINPRSTAGRNRAAPSPPSGAERAGVRWGIPERPPRKATSRSHR